MSKHLNRREFLKKISVGSALLTLPRLLPANSSNLENLFSKKSKTNILYIMSDDHAANAISAYGSVFSKIVKTPNIDRIANEGMRLNRVFCTNSICTPSRATILTGQYSHHNGVYTLRDDLDPNHPNVAKMLQKAGYETAIIGKWHLHTEPQGFDYYNVLPGQGRYHNPMLKEKGKPWKKGNAGGEEYKGYVTDVITDLCIRWLKNRNTSKPFFLMCHNKAPHGLWEYAERHKDLFKDIEFPEPPSFWDDKSDRSEASRKWGRDMLNLAERMSSDKWPTGKLDTKGMTKEQKIKAAYQKYIKDYMRCIVAIDENVGRLLDFLDESGLAENTLVIYTSDQGMFSGEHLYYDKRWMFEESLQMPFLARLPGEIRAGTVNNDIIINADFAPTFLDYAGVETPKFMDGRSFRSILQGRTPNNWRKAMYYHYWMHVRSSAVPAHYGIRTERYKLIFFYGLPLGMKGATPGWVTQPGWELYDLVKDPYELTNVYNNPSYSGIIKELKAELLRLKKEVGDNDDKYPELVEIHKKYW